MGKLGDGTEEVLNDRRVKKLGMKKGKECVLGAQGLGILGQWYDEEMSKNKQQQQQRKNNEDG